MSLVRKRVVWLVALAGILAAGRLVSLPYFAEGPGPTRDVEKLIKITGHTEYASDGRFLLTSVAQSAGRLSPLELVAVWLDPSESVIPEDQVLAPGQTDQQLDLRERSEMDQSKIDATVVVLSQIGDYPEEHGEGALVEAVEPGCPADGKLYPGDLIVSIDDQRVLSRADASRAIDAVPADRPISLEVRAAGKTLQVDLARKPCGPHEEPLLGVSLLDNFPFGVSMSSAGIGGPSAGLMWALGLYDLLTPGDLTGGRTIAGTGEIGADGSVYPIGGVEKKLLGAEDAGAKIFLVPKDNLEEARSAGAGVTLVAVGTFDEAVRKLSG